MAIVDKLMVEVWNVAQRGLDGTQTSTPVAQTVTTTPTPTATNNNNQTTSGGSSSQSPLLFFVALGFGVVFTNLWIIVGVKYCFRYNARNRALARGEDGEPINLENMNRPHRRRREKKLMTMDEVNERFPMTKYKNWVATRASEGLPTAGGVTATSPSSRPASVRDANGVIPSSPVTSKSSDEERPATAVSPTATPQVTASPVSNAVEGTADTDGRKSVDGTTEKKLDNHEQTMTPLTEVDTAVTRKTSGEDDEEDEDDHIHGALPTEMVASPGDACAICIDTLEPDDDIRGLTCGHAFHAGCLDPWLTSRRACCPLCKADYFVPKPRPEGEAADAERARRNRVVLPTQPRSAWTGIRPPRGMIFPGRFMSGAMYDGPANETNAQRARRLRQQRLRALAQTESNTLEPQESTVTATAGEITTPESRSFASRITNPFTNMRLPGRRRQNETVAGTQQPTPGQLEDGVVR